MSKAPIESNPAPEAKEAPAPQRVRRRASWPERILGTAFLAALILYAFDYILGGSQGTGYLWFQARRGLQEFLAWRVEAYVWVLVPLVAVLTVALRGVLPIIEIPILSGDGGEAHWVKRWYMPGSLHVEEDHWTWREGRHRAFIHRSRLARRGALGWGVTCPVERYCDDNALEVVYDGREIPTYISRSLNRRLYREIQERIVQNHRALREVGRS